MPNALPPATRLCILALLAVALPAGPVRAQAQSAAPPANASSPGADAIKQRTEELEAMRARQKAADEAAQKLKAEIAALGQDRARLNQQLIEIAAKVRGFETSIADTENRLRPLDAREQQMRASLDSRRGEVAEVLAALQRAGRRAPPALFVRPEDALQSLRTAILLGSAVPEMRARAKKLAGELGDLVAVRRNIAEERERLKADRDRLDAEQPRLAALVQERQTREAEAARDMDTERQRAASLARQADSLQSLIARMEQDLKSAAEAAAAAELKGVPPKPDPKALKNPARLSPAIAFASAKKLLPLPVNGTRIRNFGGSDGSGGQERGVSIATKPGAQVTTPCDCWVVYAGPFRSYGQLLILNAGGGYHVLLAGVERISVNIGQFVLTGEPVATMGSQSQIASILAAPSSQPVLYIEFRKDGTPIDPGPWWAKSEGEKVRG